MSVNFETGEIANPLNYEIHPAADLFPLIEGEAFRQFVEDIRVRGQEVPVVLDADGRLLDGRNRARACQALGIDVLETRYSGDDPVGFVVSHNMQRRHLTESQRALVAAKVANMGRGGNRGNQYSAAKPSIDGLAGTSTAEAAAQLNVGTSSVERARRVMRDAPELVPEIEAGHISVNAARDIAAAAPDDAEQRAELLARKKSGEPINPKPATESLALPQPPKYGGNQRKHIQIIDALTTTLSGVAITVAEIVELDNTVTAEEADRLTVDLSRQIKALQNLNRLLKERTK